MSNNSNSAIKFISTLIKFSVGSWVGALVSIIAIPIITRSFSPEEFGKYNMYLVSISLLSIIVIAGIDHSYIRFFNDQERKGKINQLFANALIVTFVIWLFLSMVLILFSTEISQFLFKEENKLSIFLICLAVLSSIIMRFLNLTYRMRLDPKNYAIQVILLSFVSKSLFIIAALWSPTYHNAILVTSISYVFLVVFYLIRQRNIIDYNSFRYSKVLANQMYRYSLPLVPETMIAWLNIYLANILILHFLDVHSLGIYSIAISIVAILNIVQLGFSNYWSGYYLKYYETEQDKIVQIHSYIAFAMVLLGLLLILFQDLIFLLLGEKYREAKEIFPFLLWTPICYTISETTAIGINISKKTIFHTISTIISLIFTVVFGIIFIKIWGIIGISIGVGIGGIALFIFRTFFGQRYYISVNKIAKTYISISFIVFASFLNLLEIDNLLKNSIIFLFIFVLFYLYSKQVRKLSNISKTLIRKYK